MQPQEAADQGRFAEKVMARHLATVSLLGGAFCALWSAGETLAGWYLMEPPSVQTPADQLYLAAALAVDRA